MALGFPLEAGLSSLGTTAIWLSPAVIKTTFLHLVLRVGTRIYRNWALNLQIPYLCPSPLKPWALLHCTAIEFCCPPWMDNSNGERIASKCEFKPCIKATPCSNAQLFVHGMLQEELIWLQDALLLCVLLVIENYSSCKKWRGKFPLLLNVPFSWPLTCLYYFFIFLDWVSRCFSALRITFAAEGGAYTSKGRGMFSLSKHVLLHLTEHWKQKLLLDFIAEGAALPI